MIVHRGQRLKEIFYLLFCEKKRKCNTIDFSFLMKK